jgi:hypothetical protein
MIIPYIIEDLQEDTVMFMVKTKLSRIINTRESKVLYLEMKKSNIKFSSRLAIMSQLFAILENSPLGKIKEKEIIKKRSVS